MPDQLVVLEHRDNDECARATEVGKRNGGRMALEIGWLCPEIFDLDRPVRYGDGPVALFGCGTNGLLSSVSAYSRGTLQLATGSYTVPS